MRSPKDRKLRSEAILGSVGVHINPNLPLTETEEETKLRTSEEIARRAICLTAVVSRAFGDKKDFLIEYLRKKSCYEYLTPEEDVFLNKPRITTADKIKFQWQVEALRVLLWSIGYAQISLPTFQKCDPYEDVFPECSSPESDGRAFISEAGLISKSELVELSDIVYRAHWATRQHELDKCTGIGPLDPGVVLEYHRAINWITCYGDDIWDNVSTDT